MNYFKFKHVIHNNLNWDFTSTARKINDNMYVAMWIEEGRLDCVTYSKDEVKKCLDQGTWILIEEYKED